MSAPLSFQHPPRSDARSRSRTKSVSGSTASQPPAAFRQRGSDDFEVAESFNAPEVWHEPAGRPLRMITHPPGAQFRHAVSAAEVRERLAALPEEFTAGLEIVQFSTMTRKRRTCPCYGMQWGVAIYLYPIESSLIETYTRPPTPQQRIEARMFGGRWSGSGNLWQLEWTEQTLRDFYLHNVLIHELGHYVDGRNTKPAARERYANWFAIEFGYRPWVHSRRADTVPRIGEFY